MFAVTAIAKPSCIYICIHINSHIYIYIYTQSFVAGTYYSTIYLLRFHAANLGCPIVPGLGRADVDMPTIVPEFLDRTVC